MKRSRLVIFSIISAVCVAVAVIITLIYLNMSGDTPEVHLPQPTSNTGNNDGNVGSSGENENVIEYAELRPDTVQYILEIIEKPESYSCRYTIENFWENGSGAFDVGVYVKGDIFRVYQLSDIYMKECIFTDNDYYIWYQGEENYYHGVRGEAVSGEDIENAVQMTGSYKDLMELEVSDILEVSYYEEDESFCIYVRAKEGVFGYLNDYYISTDTGLLLKHEIYKDDMLVYRMTERETELSAPADSYFTLPDGTLIS